MRNLIPRLGVAVPDCLTAATYLVAWTAPTQLDPARFRNLLAAIVIEFLVLHASALYGFGIAKREDRLHRRAWILGGLSVLYLIPITFMAVQLRTDGPILAFFWLFTSRFAFILIHPESAAAETRRTVTLWVISLLAFIVGTIAVNKIPLPSFGLTRQFVASLSMSGHPNPKAQPPQITIAFGVFYFLVQAGAKFCLAGAGREKERAATFDDGQSIG
ncbi:MAG: hypothetical protein H0X40_08350 [Chthoniobacterales bacterium]|nr:hypothetical protein [Chthoniobacterales bacterium]